MNGRSPSVSNAWRPDGSPFGTERLTGALLDRLTHHLHIIEMNGDSYRLGQSRARQADVSV
jgi:hypothetical protein